MNWILINFTASYLFIGIIFLILAAFVYIKNPKKLLHKVFSLYAFSMSWWAFFSIPMINASNTTFAILMDKICLVGVIFIAPTLFHFNVLFLKLESRFKKLIKIFYILAVFFLLSVWSPHFVKGISPRLPIKSFSDPAIIYHIFICYFTAISIIAISLYLLKLKRCIKGTYEHMQLKYLFWATFFGYLLGGGFNYQLVYKMVPPVIVPFGNYALTIYGIIIAYAIVRHRLLDIRVAITRAGVFLFTYALVLGLPFLLYYYTNQGWLSTGLAVAFATAGPFVYSRLKSKIENVLLKEQIKYQKAIRSLAERMVKLKEVDKILREVGREVYEIVKPEFLGVYVYSQDIDKYVLKEKFNGSSKTLPGDILKTSELIEKINKSKRPEYVFVGNHLGEAFFLPFFHQEKLHSFILLGARRDKTIDYLQQEDAFETLSSQTQLAIENCMFWQERGELLLREAQVARFRAMDHLSGGIAHQIQNPITAVLCEARTLKDRLNSLNRKDVLEEDQTLIKEKTDGIIFNIERIARIVDAMRNFMRSDKTTGTFKVDEVLKEVFLLYAEQMKLDGIFFTRDPVKEDVYVEGNKGLLMTSITTLLDNAIKAVKANKALARTAESGEVNSTRKEISLKTYPVKENKIIIEVKDNGIGINKKMGDDIFLFCVGTKASTEGTGLGLFLLRGIVESHNGRIWFESEGEGLGAAFFVELPIVKGINN